MIGAVVVSYNPDNQLHETLMSLRSQVDYLLLIDNGSSCGTAYISNAREICDKVNCLSCNSGVAYAYNLGADILNSMGCDSFLISDQDTIYMPDCLNQLEAAAKQSGLAIISPNVFDSNKKQWKRFETFGRLWFRRAFVSCQIEPVSISVSSGTFYKFDVYSSVGRFREDFFIDYVDTEYCMRAGRLGIPTLIVKDAIINHSLGYSTKATLFGKNFYPKNYSSFRRFYIYRNRVICWTNLYKFGYFAWDILAMANDLFLLLAFEDNKTSKLWAAIKGLVQGAYYSLGRSNKTSSPRIKIKRGL